jgi:hypothetical protein
MSVFFLKTEKECDKCDKIAESQHWKGLKGVTLGVTLLSHLVTLLFLFCFKRKCITKTKHYSEKLQNECDTV